MSNMTRQEALRLIGNLINAEIQVTKESNTRRGLTKKTAKWEREAAEEIFRHLQAFMGGEYERITDLEWHKIDSIGMGGQL